MTVCFPKRGSYIETICKIIYKHGALTVDEGIAIHQILGKHRTSTRAIYMDAIKYDYLIKTGDKFHLTERLIWYYDGCAIDSLPRKKKEVTPARTPAPFKPMEVQKRDELQTLTPKIQAISPDYIFSFYYRHMISGEILSC